MHAIDIPKTAKILGGVISKNSSTILTGVAVGGVVTTIVFAITGTIKALSILDSMITEPQTKDTINIQELPSILPKKEVFLLTWKCYIPALATGLITIVCIIAANSIGLQRNAALAGLYGLTEATLKEYQSKIVETIGKNKELAVRDDISADRLKQHPIGDAEVIFTGKGEIMCYDSLSGRYFKSEVEKIRKSQNKLNRDLISENFVTLNELYDELGLSNIKLGYDMGWDVDKMIDITFSAQLTDEEEPCLVLNYEVKPKYI